MIFFLQNDGSKSSSGRRKQSCPSKAPTENSVDNKSLASIKNTANNDIKVELSNAKAWSNNIDTKVSEKRIFFLFALFLSTCNLF